MLSKFVATTLLSGRRPNFPKKNLRRRRWRGNILYIPFGKINLKKCYLRLDKRFLSDILYPIRAVCQVEDSIFSNSIWCSFQWKKSNNKKVHSIFHNITLYAVSFFYGYNWITAIKNVHWNRIYGFSYTKVTAERFINVWNSFPVLCH